MKLFRSEIQDGCHLENLFCTSGGHLGFLIRTILAIFSSPEQRSGRAIVLPPASVLALALALASVSTNVKVFVKVFKTSLFPNLITDLIIFGMIIHIGQKFAQYHPHHSRSSQGQGHRLRIFMLKFYV